MKRYLAYLSYVVRHRWYVMLECFRVGLIWRGLVHDLSKFLPSEFFPYARFFHEKDGAKKQRRDKTGYYKPDDTGDAVFDRAWFMHQARNRHHWQYWVLARGDGTQYAFAMPNHDWLEMVCDWHGAARAQGIKTQRGDRLSVRAWWWANREKMRLHPYTDIQVTHYIHGRPLPRPNPKAQHGG